MSPLIILLLMLILIIGSSHQITKEKNRIDEENGKFPRIVDQNSSLIDKSLNYVTMSAEKNERDPSTMRENKLRHDLEHLLSSVVKKIILQRKIEGTKKQDDEIKRKILGKSVGSNKIPLGKYPEDNNGVERGVEIKRPNANNKIAIGRNNGSQVREKLKKDLVQISEALMPNIRRISDFGVQDPRNYTESRNVIERENKSKEVENFRMKRQSSQEKTNGPTNWLRNDLVGHVDNFKMHAFIVKDEEIPPCCSPANPISNRRFFMCSGAILSSNRAITSASCIHFADIHESSVEAALGVHVGATDSRSYVIKINRYEMHPDYEFDVDSKNYANNNLAILYLDCSIVPEDVNVPKLPKGLNDDVAHVCCREDCDLITLTVTPDNKNIASSIRAKHLPAPVHDDEDSPAYRQLSENALESLRQLNKRNFNNETYNFSRRVRSPLKFAAAPTFSGITSARRSSRLQNGKISSESSNVKKGKKSKKQKTILRKQQKSKKLKKLFNFDSLLSRKIPGRTHMSIMRALEKQGVNVQEQLAAIDWDEIEEIMSKKFTKSNRDKMEVFAQNVVQETMKRVENVLGDDDEDLQINLGNRSRIFQSLMPNKLRNKTIENFVHVFTKVVSSLVPNGMTIGGIGKSFLEADLEEKDLTDPPALYEKCPPIGTPVFANGTLVALLAYSCDDLQDWVQWKYVNIAKNLNWIQEQMKKDIDNGVRCSGPNRPIKRSFPYNLPFPGKSQRKNSETEIQERKIGWNTRERSAEMQRSIYTGNLDHARNSERRTYPRIPKDSWFARNSPLTPKLQPENEQRRKIFEDSRNQSKVSQQNQPIVNINDACYVKPDGSTTCQTRNDFAIR